MNITFTVPAMKFGGAERVISILSNQWTKMGHNVNIIIVGEDPACAYPLDSIVNVVCLGGPKKRAITAHIQLIRKIRKTILELKTDTTISFLIGTCAYTALALLGKNIPLIYSERADPFVRKKRKSMRVFQALVNVFSKGMVFQTEGAKEFYSKKIQRQSVVILNPFDTDILPRYDIENRKKEIVTMGRLESQKNHKLLIEAFALIADEFKDYKLKIYGDGILKEELQKQIDVLGLSGQVELMGAQKDILNKINKASLFVLSSDFEGLPNALIEAMCVGIPSVSTDCSPGGARELIKDGENGFIVPCNDAKSLADAMKKVLSDNELAQKISVEGKKIAKRMECDQIAKKWIDFIQSLK